MEYRIGKVLVGMNKVLVVFSTMVIAVFLLVRKDRLLLRLRWEVKDSETANFRDPPRQAAHVKAAGSSEGNS